MLAEQRVAVSGEVYGQLDEAFRFDHEVGFTLYSSGRIIDVARDHTDYEAYRNGARRSSFHRDEGLCRLDTENLQTEGFTSVGCYHTHPGSEGLADVVLRQIRGTGRSFHRDGRRVKPNVGFPSSGDINNWVGDPFSRDRHLIIGTKGKQGSPLVVGAYVPIATFVQLPKECNIDTGHSALKSVHKEERWRDDTEMDEQLAAEYKRVLQPFLTIGSGKLGLLYKGKSVPFEWYFIEVPIEITDT